MMYELLPSCWGTFRTTSKTSPATGERFVLLRKPPQLLGNVSYYFESLPSCWGTFRTASKASPAAGEHFQRLESFPSCWGAFPAPGFLPQSLGNISSSGISSPAAGERFQHLESFPSRWGAFPASGILPQLLAEYRPGHFQIDRCRQLDISLIFSRLPSTSETGCPAASTTEASSVKNGV